MKKAHWLTAFVLTGAMSSVGHAAPERVGDFALLDHNGDFHQISRYRHKDAVVVFSQANNCASSEAAIAQFRELRSQWQDKDVAFLMMNSAGEDLQSIRQAAESQGLDFPIMLDTSQLVAQTLKVSKTNEVIVLDPQQLSVLYRGPVHEHIGMTLTGIQSGTAAETMVMDAVGCDLDVPAAPTVAAGTAPDYATEVAPIIVESCAECHREGGIGPFALDSHLMLQGWSPMIREVLLTKRMPPMQIDPYVGHFKNAGHITDEDMQTVVRWIDAGAPRGTASHDPLTGLEFADIRAWQLSEPDYIVEMPTYEVPATGVLDYINVDVELPFEEDKWVRAVQFVPGAPDVLHHILTYVTAPAEDFDGGEADQRSIARRFLEGYAPGKVETMEFPEETGVYIPKGHKLSMQYHFTTNGRATSDQTNLGLWFYDEKPKHENLTRSVSGRFTIPPHAIDHKAHGTYTFQEDVVLNGLRAHMHFRGKNMKFTAEYPDGKMEDILSVPNYSYAWQPTYQLTEHKRLPAGTKVHVTGAFDNSAYNPANPDPDAEVTFGLQTWEEMFIGYWTYYLADK